MMMILFSARSLFSVFVLLCAIHFAAASTLLPNDEVDALREIAATLGKKDWDFDADPCGVDLEGGWGDNKVIDETSNAVTCQNFTDADNNTVPHVVSIVLKEQSLSGTLPPQLFRLPHLQNFDVTRNYLNNIIPTEWGSTKLVNISILGNRLTGPIPKELGNISTLEKLVVESNQLSGPLPLELGNLSQLLILHLTSNNFTEELPQTFVNLTKLQQLRLSDNQFTGKIPDFIQNLTNLEELIIQASGLKGPIPSGISLLEKLSDLRITDLDGPESQVPQLNCTDIERLMLRSCNLTGELPDYLAKMTKLKILDLSFNKLSGIIPLSFNSLKVVDYIYLTGNQLTGEVPDWILEEVKYADLSYNNFNDGGGGCQVRDVNLFASSAVDNVTSYHATSGLVSCLKNHQPCTKDRYNLFINCGGSEERIGDNTYNDDTWPLLRAASSSFSSANYWGYSNTGHFLDDGVDPDRYVAANVSVLSMENPQLYMTARRSAISLTYYGFCLMNEIYNVSLHFAEITFTGNESYTSLGRRAFNVYIQGKLVLEDFNIESEAGGVGKEVVKNFTANVTNGTLEIRFYWAGKGTNIIPTKGVYGPLISAISVYPDFEPPAESTSISAGTMVGIVAAVVFVVFLILVILWWRGCLGREDELAQDLKVLALQIGSFTLRQIKAATNNFDAANKIGEGGFGSVYKGLLSDGTTIAVKQLSSKSKQGNREFVTELGMISALQHPHLVKLYGCCIEGNQLLLVYEYMENNSLARALFGPEEFQLKLDWQTRHKICVGIARGLAYLHEESRLKIVHRDIKATNVLLDKDLNPKISDFGLAKLDEEDNTHISTKIAGTYGYMAPEYAMHGYLTDKADIYSFGIVALEVVSGRSNTSYQKKEKCFYLLDWARLLKEKGNLMDLVDRRLGSQFDQEEVLAMIKVALLCTNATPALRPPMSSVVSMLEGKAAVPVLDTEGAIATEETIEAMRKHFKGEEDQEVGENITKSMSTEGPWTGTASSTSANDLYPINLDTDYWQNRK
ncbi:probable leucine-rich repeat receptor-like serine/threonine-protein kinase At3g14840 [Syzygium oleosum]|uniref:probable leucine-rich repeat receptor-like serine/threonine-protein kinase At3g14840 n=1 Tax=Syzygium oleosum TaxID=219896 RepID=UPI0024BAAA79|nr:probable leucine-rich repeat receptor-like serine/threonine-protein kinase At3g14840 [Syzygium oleosum]XP_056173117.1 probable leucine-rich repeat receptor-like serine/threonine-protein kinase At3g14840 [Syzygium oleosum]